VGSEMCIRDRPDIEDVTDLPFNQAADVYNAILSDIRNARDLAFQDWLVKKNLQRMEKDFGPTPGFDSFVADILNEKTYKNAKDIIARLSRHYNVPIPTVKYKEYLKDADGEYNSETKTIYLERTKKDDGTFDQPATFIAVHEFDHYLHDILPRVHETEMRAERFLRRAVL